MLHYVDATGHSPVMPEWAAGYWHSPMGAPDFNQTMAIDAVDGLAARGIPTDIYVIDYFNWAKMGDYTFNPEMWPDPAGMVQHFASKGVRLMVSAWPYTLKDGARASSEITKPGNGVRFPDGSMTPWPDSVCGDVCYLYDPTSQSGRNFVWVRATVLALPVYMKFRCRPSPPHRSHPRLRQRSLLYSMWPAPCIRRAPRLPC